MTEAQEWLRAAILCGYNPRMFEDPDGAVRLSLNLRGIDHRAAPDPLPDQLMGEVADMLKIAGRYHVVPRVH
jgi:hypothetical protein